MTTIASRTTPLIGNHETQVSEEWSTGASDDWFAEKARKNERESNGLSRFAAGVIGVGVGIFQAFRGDPAPMLAYGANNMVGGTIESYEGSLVASETAVDAKIYSREIKKMALFSALPLAALAVVTTSSWVLGIVGAAALTAVKYAAARNAERQVDFIAHPETETIKDSDKWYLSKDNLRLPRNLRKVEQVLEYVKTGVYGFTAFATVFGTPLLGILFGLAAGYSYWKARKVLPDVINYYDDMSDETERILDTID